MARRWAGATTSHRPGRFWWVRAGGMLAIGCLALLAAQADSDRPGWDVWSTAVDIGIGVAFVVAAAAAPGSRWSRWWFAGVGASWLTGSFMPDAVLVHQAVLIVALMTFPAGRPRGRVDWLFVALAVPVAFLLVSQFWVAVLFAAVAASTLIRLLKRQVAVWYPTLASAGVAAAIGASWSARRFDIDSFGSSAALRTYEIALGAVAVGFPIAAAAVVARRTRLTERVLADVELAGLDGLAAVLRDVLGDPDLRIHQWLVPDVGDVHGDGEPHLGGRLDRRWLYVSDDTSRLAAIEHRSAALDDEPTAVAVSAAVRLTVVNQQLQDRLAAQLDDLEATRVRLVDAADHQRAVTARRLQGDVLEPLERVAGDLSVLEATPHPGRADGVEAVGIVVQELRTAADEVTSIIAGVAPAHIGGGRLRDAVEALTLRSAVPATVTATPGASADIDTEAALFYVCSEALANAVKHAAASVIEVSFSGDLRSVRVRITDDGCGGADPAGSGLRGIGDRLAARGGRLEVYSPPGAGTVVTATIPRPPSAS